MFPLRLGAVLLGCLVLCGTGRAAQPWIPPAEDTVARQFIDQLRLGQVDAAFLTLDPAVRNADGLRGLETISGLFHGGQARHVEVIGGSVGADPRLGGRRVLVLTYQVELTTGWFAGNIGLAERDGLIKIAGARFNKMPASLAQLNAFTLRGKGWVHWIFLELAVVVPLFTLAVLVLCLRSRVRSRWLWAAGIVLGVFAVQLNWSSGEVVVSPVTVQLFGAGATRQGLYGPWMIAVAFPLAAVVFLAVRKRLPLRAPRGKKKKA